MPPHPSLYLKRDVYDQAALKNGEYFDTEFTCAADYDFILRVLSEYCVEPAYLKKVLVKMCVGGISNRSLGHIITKSKEDWRVIRRNGIGGLHTLLWKNVSKARQFFAA
jgi:glycosyltransferase